MYHLVERMRLAGCGDITVVSRPQKTDVIEYARSEGLKVVEASPPSVSESVLAGITEVPEGHIVLLGFPDSIWEPKSGFSELVDALRTGSDVALGLFRASEPARCDVVTMKPDGTVSSIDVKPEIPSSDLIWGCAAVKRHVLEELCRDPEPGVVFGTLSRTTRVTGVFLSDSWVDIGTPEAFEAYVGRPHR